MMRMTHEENETLRISNEKSAMEIEALESKLVATAAGGDRRGYFKVCTFAACDPSNIRVSHCDNACTYMYGYAWGIGLVLRQTCVTFR